MNKHHVMFYVFVTIFILGTGCTDLQNTDSRMRSSDVMQPAEDPFDPDRPPTAKTLYLMADILSTQGKDGEAEQLYRRIRTTYPAFQPVFNAYAGLLMRQRRIPEATKLLEAGLKLNPRDPVLHNNMGMCFLIRKDYSRALHYFTEAAAIVPENTRYRSNMATALALAGRREEALALYKQILPEDEAAENIRILCDRVEAGRK